MNNAHAYPITLQKYGYTNYDINNPLCNGKNKYFSPDNTMIQITYNGKDFVFEIYDQGSGISEGKAGLEQSCNPSSTN